MLPSFENRKMNIDKSFTKLCKVNKKYVYENNNLILLFSLMDEIAILPHLSGNECR
jgi:hypothetical protein